MTLRKIALAGMMLLGAHTAEAAWVDDALTHQRTLDQYAPLAQANFLMTHNSFNSTAYANIFSYWADPNQSLSLSDQLNAGVRSLELDTHWYNSALRLCHGQNNHTGCAVTDRELKDGLQEVANWLRARPSELVVLYIEDHMDGHYGDAVNYVHTRLGDMVYRPQGGGCQGIPMTVAKSQLRQLGKQVLLMGGSDVCTSNSGWASWAFAGVGDYLSGYPTGSTDAIVGGDECNYSKYPRSFYNNHWVRFYEDRTWISSTFGDPDTPITADVVTKLQKCGVNLTGLDKLESGDSRRNAFVWSWDVNEPNDWGGNEDCAQHWGNGRLNDAYCGNSMRFACKYSDGRWYVTQAAGPWINGSNQCASETAGAARYATPVNGYDNERLKQAKQAAGSTDVWLNYNDLAQEGQWQTGDIVPPALSSGELSVRVVSASADFEWVYDDSGTGANNDVSIWRAKAERYPGYYPLGHIVGVGYSRPQYAVLVRDQGDALARPLDYTQTWDDRGSGGTHDGSFWKPVAPSGYTCLGHLTVRGYGKPSTDAMRCVNNRYLVRGGALWRWDDRGSGASRDITVYDVSASDGNGLAPNTLESRPCYCGAEGNEWVLDLRKLNVTK